MQVSEGATHDVFRDNLLLAKVFFVSHSSLSAKENYIIIKMCCFFSHIIENNRFCSLTFLSHSLIEIAPTIRTKQIILIQDKNEIVVVTGK